MLLRTRDGEEGIGRSSLSALSLLTSFGTLVCCALPSLLVLFGLGASAASPAFASGHGPVFGLATPTLGRGAWSLDLLAVGRSGAGGNRGLLRPMLSYGITEDLQISFSAPLVDRAEDRGAAARMMAMAPATRDYEALLGWRFARRGTAIGSRRESTVYFGYDVPADERRGEVRPAPALLVAAVTGHASRSTYLWVGGLYRRSLSPADTRSAREGDLLMATLVLGYRPLAFRRELPHADWRIFLELIGERRRPDQLGGAAVPATGGDRLFLGPTVLGLFGRWGISGGPLFPVYTSRRDLSDTSEIRFGLTWTVWF